MIITENTMWNNEYEQISEYDVALTISYCSRGEVKKSYKYIIPIEFYDDVKIWEWEVVCGENIIGTPVISVRHDKAIKKLLKDESKKPIISLNNITPFAWKCKNGKIMVSSKNDYSYRENSEKGVIWYSKDEEEQAVQCYDKYIEKCLR